MYGLILPRMAQIHLDLVSVLSDEELAQFDTLLARLRGHHAPLAARDAEMRLAHAHGHAARCTEVAIDLINCSP